MKNLYSRGVMIRPMVFYLLLVFPLYIVHFINGKYIHIHTNIQEEKKENVLGKENRKVGPTTVLYVSTFCGKLGQLPRLVNSSYFF